MTLRAILKADRARGGMTGFDLLSLAVIRFNQALRNAPRPVRLVGAFLDLLWLRLIVGAEIPPTAAIGAGLRLPHSGRMVIIHPNCAVGAGATIYHGVTLGASGPDPGAVPTLGDDVYVGCGATIIGRVNVGNGAKIAAGAVVVHDVPAGATVAGVPARVVRARDGVAGG
jgi:serine O-acetyltransferase